jgi:hypothetical protein
VLPLVSTFAIQVNKLTAGTASESARYARREISRGESIAAGNSRFNKNVFRSSVFRNNVFRQYLFHNNVFYNAFRNVFSSIFRSNVFLNDIFRQNVFRRKREASTNCDSSKLTTTARQL